MKVNKSLLIGLAIWIVLFVFRYFGDYAYFIQPFFEQLLNVHWINLSLEKITGAMALNKPDAAWVTARFTVAFSMFLNYLIIRFTLGVVPARWFAVGSSAALLISVLVSPLDWVQVRYLMYQVTKLASQPLLVLLLIPLNRAYLYMNQSASAKSY